MFSNNDREHMDVENSQIAFYHSVCFPLFELNAKISPSLQCLVDQIKRNMSAWEKRLEEKREKIENDEKEKEKENNENKENEKNNEKENDEKKRK